MIGFRTNTLEIKSGNRTAEVQRAQRETRSGSRRPLCLGGSIPASAGNGSVQVTEPYVKGIGLRTWDISNNLSHGGLLPRLT